MSWGYTLTCHLSTKTQEDYVDKCRRIGVNKVTISPRVTTQLTGSETHYYLTVMGENQNGRKAKLALEQPAKKYEGTLEDSEPLWKKDILAEATRLANYLRAHGIESEFSNIRRRVLDECSVIVDRDIE